MFDDGGQLRSLRRRRRHLLEHEIHGDPHMNRIRRRRRLLWHDDHEGHETLPTTSGVFERRKARSGLARIQDPSQSARLPEADPIPDADVPLVERAMEELDTKARHYFVLFSRERKARQKLEQAAYWLEQNGQQLRKELQEQTYRSQELSSKLEALRGHPGVLTAAVERIDLLYAQLDTLVQSLAGLACYLAYKELTREQALMTVLDYLYPCRALYGSTYYCMLGIGKDVPVPPLPPPVTVFVPQGEGTPWLPAGLKFSEAPKTPAGNERGAVSVRPEKTTIAREKQPAPPHRSDVEVSKKRAIPKTDEKTKIHRAPLQKDQAIVGFQVLLHSVANVKTPEAMFDHENSLEVRSSASRSTPVVKVASGVAEFNYLLTVTDLPARVPGVVPSFVIDLWSPGDEAPLGTAVRSFIDIETLKEESTWDILDPQGNIIGTVKISLGAIPHSAPLPAQRFLDSKAEAAMKAQPNQVAVLSTKKPTSPLPTKLKQPKGPFISEEPPRTSSTSPLKAEIPIVKITKTPAKTKTSNLGPKKGESSQKDNIKAPEKARPQPKPPNLGDHGKPAGPLQKKEIVLKKHPEVKKAIVSPPVKPGHVPKPLALDLKKTPPSPKLDMKKPPPTPTMKKPGPPGVAPKNLPRPGADHKHFPPPATEPKEPLSPKPQLKKPLATKAKVEKELSAGVEPKKPPQIKPEAKKPPGLDIKKPLLKMDIKKPLQKMDIKKPTKKLEIKKSATEAETTQTLTKKEVGLDVKKAVVLAPPEKSPEVAKKTSPATKAKKLPSPSKEAELAGKKQLPSAKGAKQALREPGSPMGGKTDPGTKVKTDVAKGKKLLAKETPKIKVSSDTPREVKKGIKEAKKKALSSRKTSITSADTTKASKRQPGAKIPKEPLVSTSKLVVGAKKGVTKSKALKKGGTDAKKGALDKISAKAILKKGAKTVIKAAKTLVGGKVSKLSTKASTLSKKAAGKKVERPQKKTPPKKV